MNFKNQTENQNVIKALINGKQVQCKYKDGNWEEYDPKDYFSFGPWLCTDDYQWRIKPEAITKTVTITKPVVVTNLIKHDIPVQLENLKTDFYKAGERIWYVYVTSSNEVTKNETLVNHNQDKEYKNHFIFTSKEAMEKGYEVIQKSIEKEIQ